MSRRGQFTHLARPPPDVIISTVIFRKDAHMPGFSFSLRSCSLLPALLMALTLGGCERGPRPNIVLITVDTLRPDCLSYSGGRDGVSPTIDALAASGVTYTNAYSVSGWTLPSIASIMTGRYPREHGKVGWESDIDESMTTMAQLLKSHGYSTAAFVSHVVLKKGTGLSSGFDTYDDSVLDAGHPHKVSTAAILTDLAIGHLRGMNEPFFLWIHYFDPHFDYVPHRNYLQFGDTETDRYDQEISYTDEHIGRLVRALHDEGSLDDTAIIFTSDHGEEFGEHGGAYHRTLYEEVLRVPFIVRAPGLAPRTDDRRVEQVDFLPTVYGLLGITAPELPGRDVLAPAERDGRWLYFERQHPQLWNQHGVFDGRHKLIVVEAVDTSLIAESMRHGLPKIRREVQNVIPGIYLYDLVADPGETTNLYTEDHALGRALLARLVEYMESGSPVETPRIEVDEKTLKKLRSLGYIQ